MKWIYVNELMISVVNLTSIIKKFFEHCKFSMYFCINNEIISFNEYG